MPTLSANQLIEGIKQGRPLTPFSIDLDVLDKYVERVMANHLELGTASIEAGQMFQHLKEQLDFISPKRRSLLSGCEIFVLPFPLCLSLRP